MSARTDLRLWPVFLISAGALTAFFVPLAVLPIQMREAGFPASVAAVTSAAFLTGVVAGEIGAAAVIARLGDRLVLCCGLALLAGPGFALAIAEDPVTWSALSVVRGVGFAVVVVATAALVAAGARDGHRGRLLGWYGLVAGIPAVFGLPIGVVVSSAGGSTAAHLVASGAAAVGIPLALLVPSERAGRRRRPPTNRGSEFGLLGMLRQRAVAVPAGSLALAAVASGALIALAPAIVAPGNASAAAALLFTATLAAPMARVVAGRLGDSSGPERIVAPALGVAGAGLGLVLAGGWMIPMLGAAGVGAGFGLAQNATLQTMSERAPVQALGAVSALWNLAYDLGLLIGTVVFAVLAAIVAPTVAVLAIAVCCLIAASVLALARRAEHPAPRTASDPATDPETRP